MFIIGQCKGCLEAYCANEGVPVEDCTPESFLPRLVITDKDDALDLMLAVSRYAHYCSDEYGITHAYVGRLYNLLNAVTLEVKRHQDARDTQEDENNG